MLLLTIGVVLWSCVHFVPAVPLDFRRRFVARFDVVAFKALAALLIVASVAIMVAGWGSAPAKLAFTPPAWGASLTLVLMLAASILLFAPYMQSNLRRLVRHPQLTGLLLWSIGHTIATGQWRSLILFGGLGLWAVVEMILINRRDGPWRKPEKVSAVSDLRLVLAGLGFFAIMMFTHASLFGVSPVPRWP